MVILKPQIGYVSHLKPLAALVQSHWSNRVVNPVVLWDITQSINIQLHNTENVVCIML